MKDHVVYKNSQWKLINNDGEWFFEQIPHDETQPYWCYVREVMTKSYSFAHVAEKTWCEVGAWGDVCRKAAEISPCRLEYDLDEQIKIAAAKKEKSINARREDAAKAKRSGSRFLKPSEISDDESYSSLIYRKNQEHHHG